MSHYFETCWAQKGSLTSFFVRNLLLLKIILEPVYRQVFWLGIESSCRLVSYAILGSKWQLSTILSANT